MRSSHSTLLCVEDGGTFMGAIKHVMDVVDMRVLELEQTKHTEKEHTKQVGKQT